MKSAEARAGYRSAMALLRRGEYRAGFARYEARSYLPELGFTRPALPFPEWRGEDLSGRRILVWPEQGLGDKIMFARFIPALKTLGAEVSVLCEPALHRLLAGNLPVDCIAASGSVELPQADFWVFYGSLPHRLGMAPSDLSGAYLHVPPRMSPGARIGVAARGNPRHPNDANRSMPADAALALHSLPGAMSLEFEDLAVADLQDTAELIAGLELVVTVDSVLAHLAGALGKPVWVLLPAVGRDWRWLPGRRDTVWYPTMRLYAQSRAGDWSGVLEAVRGDLGTPTTKVTPPSFY